MKSIQDAVRFLFLAPYKILLVGYTCLCDALVRQLFLSFVTFKKNLCKAFGENFAEVGSIGGLHTCYAQALSLMKAIVSTGLVAMKACRSGLSLCQNATFFRGS